MSDSSNKYFDDMAVLRNKRRSADLEEGETHQLNNTRKKKVVRKSLEAEIEPEPDRDAEPDREKIDPSRENQTSSSSKTTPHTSSTNAAADSAEDDHDNVFADSQDIFSTANEVADWTASDENEIVNFLDYREPLEDPEMGTNPLPHELLQARRRTDSQAPTPTLLQGIRRLSPGKSPNKDRHVTFRPENSAVRPPPPARDALSAASTDNGPAAPSHPVSTQASGSVSPSWMRQMSRLLDDKLVGLARSEEVHRVNNRVNAVSGEITSQRI